MPPFWGDYNIYMDLKTRLGHSSAHREPGCTDKQPGVSSQGSSSAGPSTLHLATGESLQQRNGLPPATVRAWTPTAVSGAKWEQGFPGLLWLPQVWPWSPTCMLSESPTALFTCRSRTPTLLPLPAPCHPL